MLDNDHHGRETRKAGGARACWLNLLKRDNSTNEVDRVRHRQLHKELRILSLRRYDTYNVGTVHVLDYEIIRSPLYTTIHTKTSGILYSEIE